MSFKQQQQPFRKRMKRMCMSSCSVSFLPPFPHLSSTIARPPVLLCEEEEEPDFPTGWLEATTALLRSFPKPRQEIRMHS